MGNVYVSKKNILLKKAFNIASFPDVNAIKNAAHNYNVAYGVNWDYYPAPYPGHKGTDYLTPMRTPLYGLDGFFIGNVNHMGSGLGNHVSIENGYIAFVVAHLDEIKVRKGDKVNSNTLVAYTGNTGVSQGPHLHVQTWLASANSWVDSTAYLDGTRAIPGANINPNTNPNYNYANIPAVGYKAGGETIKSGAVKEVGQYDVSINKVLNLFPTVKDALEGKKAYKKYAGKHGYSNGVLKVNYGTLNYKGKFDTDKYRYICTDQGVVVVRNHKQSVTYGTAR